MQQCREGWHLHTEPEWNQDDGEDPADDDGQAEEDEGSARRVRSTRRRQDAPDLPRVPLEDRTRAGVRCARWQDLPAVDVRHTPWGPMGG